MVQLTDRRGLAPGDPAMINARIERLPGIPLAFAARAMLALLYFFAFYDITVIGVALPTVATQFHLGTSGLNLPVTLNLVGYVVGAYVFSIAADKLGRRGALAITLSVLALGALLTAFSWDLVSLSIFRLIVGLGTGSLIAIGATYASELVPAARRGRLTQFNMVMAGIGLGAAPWIARPLMDNSTDGWRILLGLGTLAFVSIGLLRWFPESPRWLAAKGRTSEADAVMSSLEARFGDTLVPVDVASVETGQPALAKSKLPILDLLRPPYLNRMLVVVGFWLAWYFASYAVLGYEPTLLGREGLSEPNSQLFTAIGDSAFPIGAILTYCFIDKVDRRYAVAGITALFTLALVFFGIGGSNTLITIAAILFALTIVPGAAAGYTYTSEIFPTNARASAMAMGDGFGHIGGVFAPTIALAALASWGAHGTFWLLAGLGFIGFVIISLGARSATTGRELGEEDLAPTDSPVEVAPVSTPVSAGVTAGL